MHRHFLFIDYAEAAEHSKKHTKHDKTVIYKRTIKHNKTYTTDVANVCQTDFLRKAIELSLPNTDIDSSLFDLNTRRVIIPTANGRRDHREGSNMALRFINPRFFVAMENTVCTGQLYCLSVSLFYIMPICILFLDV